MPGEILRRWATTTRGRLRELFDSAGDPRFVVSAGVVGVLTGLAAIALVEGIEDEEVYKAVLGLGCAMGQGWYFGKPMTAEQTRELLAARRRSSSGEGTSAVVNG